MNGVIRKVNARMLGIRVVDVDGRQWNLNQLWFADDTALIADSEKRLQQLVEKYKSLEGCVKGENWELIRYRCSIEWKVASGGILL